ncbi:helix-turn-helix domain-containing protein [Aquimarina hainanensis]|uniref:Helix-turn-helix domain-containing protein n=1 Tax=Aquimarina hainanensis TaxID=1578017 RepID=A0ABW5N696_9FLAO
MEQTEIDTYIRKVGDRIKSLRKEQGMTQLDLATSSDIDVRQIQRLENGHTSATLKTLLKVTNGLNIGILDFFDFLKNENIKA